MKQSFNKQQLIEENKQSDKLSSSMKQPVGILALFHNKKWSGGTQRLIIDKDDVLELHNEYTKQGCDRDQSLGMIDYQVKKKKGLVGNRELAYALINYLPYTKSWEHTETYLNEYGFVMNFDVDDEGIACRQVMINDFETWKELSTEMQIEHQTDNSFMGNMLKAIPTEKVLTTEQKAEIEKVRSERKGMKQFYYGEEYVWAINKKNADKKAKKLNLVQYDTPFRMDCK